MNQTNQRRDYRRVPNFNFMPSERQERILPSRQLLLRLLLAMTITGGAFVVINLYQQRPALQATIDSTQRRVQLADKNLAAANAKKEEAKKLQATIASLKNQNEATKQDWALATQRTDWPKVMTTFWGSKPEGVQLRSIIVQGTTQVTVAGTATDYPVLMRFRDGLLASPVISRVVSLSSNKAEASLSFSLVAEVRAGK